MAVRAGRHTPGATAALGLVALWIALDTAPRLVGPLLGGRSAPEPCEAPHELAPRPERPAWTDRVGCGDRASADPGRALRGPARLLFGARLDLNRADPASLEALPGIGPARAAAIVASRREAPFTSLAEVERVSGIGPRTRESLTPWLEVRPLSAAGDTPGDTR